MADRLNSNSASASLGVRLRLLRASRVESS
jgi:hypothetical protein